MFVYKSILADLLTPVSAFLRVSTGSEKAFLLESVEGGGKIGRYSFIGIDPEKSFEGSFDDFSRQFPDTRQVPPGLPPFTGGAVGAFFYDLIRDFERLPDHGLDPAPTGRRGPVLMDFYSTILAFDHVRQQILIMSHESKQRMEELEEKLRGSGSGNPSVATFEGPELNVQDASSIHPMVEGPVISNFHDGGFEAAVDKAKGYIRAGDIFQVVLSQRFETDFKGSPFNVYRALRFINPSPYMFFLKHGDLSVVGSSPEVLVRVQGTKLQYRPIAGTRRRGRDPKDEERLEQELIGDEKERAEHLMLVDLGRNDLGRVSRYGSVQVEDFMFLEKYSHVMHLVSALQGRLREGLSRFDALAACFPAGTVTGAPKIRAMEIIEELEPVRRGIYAGAIGYLDYAENLDTCIAIRTIVLQGGKAYLQAGAGIVADSVPELENKECQNKAMALFKAVELGIALSRPAR